MKVLSKKQQDLAIADGKCYICLDCLGTVNDGYDGMLCPGCATNLQKMLLNHALTTGSRRRQPRPHWP